MNRAISRSFILPVTHTSKRNCFISLPHGCLDFAAILSQYPSLRYFIFRAQWQDEIDPSVTRSALLCWNSRYNDQQSVQIPSHLAFSFGIPSGAPVTLTLIEHSTPSSFVRLEPTDAADYEIIDRNHSEVIEHLVEQCCVFPFGTPVPIWIHNTVVYLTATQDYNNPSATYAILAPTSEVEIVTKVKQTEKRKVLPPLYYNFTPIVHTSTKTNDYKTSSLDKPHDIALPLNATYIPPSGKIQNPDPGTGKMTSFHFLSQPKSGQPMQGHVRLSQPPFDHPAYEPTSTDVYLHPHTMETLAIPENSLLALRIPDESSRKLPDAHTGVPFPLFIPNSGSDGVFAVCTVRADVSLPCACHHCQLDSSFLTPLTLSGVTNSFSSSLPPAPLSQLSAVLSTAILALPSALASLINPLPNSISAQTFTHNVPTSLTDTLSSLLPPQSTLSSPTMTTVEAQSQTHDSDAKATISEVVSSASMLAIAQASVVTVRQVVYSHALTAMHNANRSRARSNERGNKSEKTGQAPKIPMAPQNSEPLSSSTLITSQTSSNTPLSASLPSPPTIALQTDPVLSRVPSAWLLKSLAVWLRRKATDAECNCGGDDEDSDRDGLSLEMERVTRRNSVDSLLASVVAVHHNSMITIPLLALRSDLDITQRPDAPVPSIHALQRPLTLSEDDETTDDLFISTGTCVTVLLGTGIDVEHVMKEEVTALSGGEENSLNNRRNYGLTLGAIDDIASVYDTRGHFLTFMQDVNEKVSLQWSGNQVQEKTPLPFFLSGKHRAADTRVSSTPMPLSLLYASPRQLSNSLSSTPTTWTFTDALRNNASSSSLTLIALTPVSSILSPIAPRLLNLPSSKHDRESAKSAVSSSKSEISQWPVFSAESLAYQTPLYSTVDSDDHRSQATLALSDHTTPKQLTPYGKKSHHNHSRKIIAFFPPPGPLITAYLPALAAYPIDPRVFSPCADTIALHRPLPPSITVPEALTSLNNLTTSPNSPYLSLLHHLPPSLAHTTLPDPTLKRTLTYLSSLLSAHRPLGMQSYPVLITPAALMPSARMILSQLQASHASMQAIVVPCAVLTELPLLQVIAVLRSVLALASDRDVAVLLEGVDALCPAHSDDPSKQQQNMRSLAVASAVRDIVIGQDLAYERDVHAYYLALQQSRKQMQLLKSGISELISGLPSKLPQDKTNGKIDDSVRNPTQNPKSMTISALTGVFPPKRDIAPAPSPTASKSGFTNATSLVFKPSHTTATDVRPISAASAMQTSCELLSLLSSSAASNFDKSAYGGFSSQLLHDLFAITQQTVNNVGRQPRKVVWFASATKPIHSVLCGAGLFSYSMSLQGLCAETRTLLLMELLRLSTTKITMLNYRSTLSSVSPLITSSKHDQRHNIWNHSSDFPPLYSLPLRPRHSPPTHMTLTRTRLSQLLALTASMHPPQLHSVAVNVWNRAISRIKRTLSLEFMQKSDGVASYSPETTLIPESTAIAPVPSTDIPENITFTSEDVDPSDTSSTSTHTTKKITFHHISGLDSQKKSILDTITLPSTFARVFSQLSTKPRSGLLLYGPPGCGKSLLVEAVAAECNVNVITVRGPELLDKYVGGSEEKVRDLFSRARAQFPSVIILDEVDSILPQRGGESTGVTDRVVNSFLCELDGVEVKAQVLVLATTSRPDLVDAAVLRPGRIDKVVYCGLSEEEEKERVIVDRRSSRACSDEDLSSVDVRTATGGSNPAFSSEDASTDYITLSRGDYTRASLLLFGLVGPRSQRREDNNSNTLSSRSGSAAASTGVNEASIVVLDADKSQEHTEHKDDSDIPALATAAPPATPPSLSCGLKDLNASSVDLCSPYMSEKEDDLLGVRVRVDADIWQWGGKVSHLTNADIIALATNAKLIIQNNWEKLESGNQEDSEEIPDVAVISEAILEQALHDTRATLSSKDHLKYQRIFQTFQQSKEREPVDPHKPQRVTQM